MAAARPMTMAEKILAMHSGEKEVVPGQIVNARPDLVMGNELSTILAVHEFHRIGAKRVFDPSKIVIVFSHFTPAKDVRTADLCREVREFVREQGIKDFYDVGRGGIEHVLLPDRGYILPGTLVVGGDSHSCTYGALGCFGTGIGSTDLAAVMILGEIWMRVPESIKIVFHGRPGRWIVGKDLILHALGKLSVEGARYMSVEYTGEALDYLPMSDRFTIANMAIEMGAKAGMIPPDRTSREFLSRVTRRKYQIVKADPEAAYARVVEFDVSKLEPQIAAPMSPDNVVAIREVEGIAIDQVFIGSCTNARIEDLRIACQILKGRKVASTTRLIVTPGSQDVYLQAMKEGLAEVITEAGGAFTDSSCGACLGGHMGVLGEGETCLSTTNRNFPGRMGHVTAKVYLANPAVAAATAVTGYVTHPNEVMELPRARPVARRNRLPRAESRGTRSRV